MNEFLLPLLKWVGGKRQLLPELTAKMPRTFNTYFEPFIGGGAMLFELHPNKAVIGDINGELINFYNAVKNNVEPLLKLLFTYQNTKEFFLDKRNIDRDPEKFNLLTSIEKAARTYYLNRTCFNGLYRVNSKGLFNTPYGHYKSPFVPVVDRFLAVSSYLKDNDVKIKHASYLEICKDCEKGDFVYFDPPYDPISSTSFTSYASDGFSQNDQCELKELCGTLDKKGVKFMLSNSATPFIKELYKDYNCTFVKAKRFVNPNREGSGSADEILVRNYR